MDYQKGRNEDLSWNLVEKKNNLIALLEYVTFKMYKTQILLTNRHIRVF